MPVYNISYDLNRPGQRYDDLIAEIKRSPGYLACSQSAWLISTTEETAEKVYQRLSPNLDKNDVILIIEVTSNYQGLLEEEQWAWINQHVTRR